MEPDQGYLDLHVLTEVKVRNKAWWGSLQNRAGEPPVESWGTVGSCCIGRHFLMLCAEGYVRRQETCQFCGPGGGDGDQIYEELASE